MTPRRTPRRTSTTPKPGSQFSQPLDTDRDCSVVNGCTVKAPELVRLNAVMDAAFKLVTLPFDGRSHRLVRGHIKRLGLPDHRLARLVSGLYYSNFEPMGSYPHDREPHPNAKCDWGFYRTVLFFAHRAALSALIERTPKSRGDFAELVRLIHLWPGALPKERQSKVAAVIAAEAADVIAGKRFKRRALV